MQSYVASASGVTLPVSLNDRITELPDAASPPRLRCFMDSFRPRMAITQIIGSDYFRDKIANGYTNLKAGKIALIELVCKKPSA